MSVLKLIRIGNLAIAILACFVCVDLLPSSPYNNIDFVICIIILIAFMSAGNILNDIQDIHVDKIAHPSRPLPSKKISINYAYLIFFLCLLVGIFSSIYINHDSQIFLYFIIAPSLFGYSLYLKKIPFCNNVIVGFLLASVFLFTSLVLVNDALILHDLATLIFGLSVIRELLKDIHDYAGDKKYNINTVPVLVGVEKAYYISLFLIVVFIFYSISLFFIPSTFFNGNIKYLISISILIEIPLLYIVYSVIKNPKKVNIKSFVDLTKVLSILGLLVAVITNI